MVSEREVKRIIAGCIPDRITANHVSLAWVYYNDALKSMGEEE